MGGLILLVLIGVLVGFVVARVRKRMGLGVTWSTWVTTVVVVGFLLLLLDARSFKHWAARRRPLPAWAGARQPVLSRRGRPAPRTRRPYRPWSAGNPTGWQAGPPGKGRARLRRSPPRCGFAAAAC